MAHLLTMFRQGRVARWISLAAVILLMAGCSATPAPTPTAATTPVPSRAPQPTQLPAATAIADASLRLIWWTPEFLSPQASQPAGLLLAKQLVAFEVANDGKIQVSAVPKARYGRGGLLDFLLAARSVAPDVLPDLVALDISELEPAAAVGLLQPLEALLDESVTAELYPFATSAGRFGDHLLAVQIAADLEHLAYRPGQVKTPPATWEELLDAGTPYLFPLGSPQAGAQGRPSNSRQLTVISQYLSAGAQFDPVTRQLTVEAEPLLRLLTFYGAAAQAGVLPPNALDLPDQDAVWEVYAQGKVPMADISARRYLADPDASKKSNFAPAPGWSAAAAPVAGGWALAITATDPARQQAAADLIAWLMKPENAGGWTAAAGWLPVSAAALKRWSASPYTDFLDRQLAGAVSIPIGAESAQAAVRLQKALESVLKGNSTAAAAVEAALRKE